MNWERTTTSLSPDIEVYKFNTLTNFILAEIRVNNSPAMEGEFDFDMWIFGAGNMNTMQTGHIHNIEQAKYYVMVFLQTTFSLWSDELDLMAQRIQSSPAFERKNGQN